MTDNNTSRSVPYLNRRDQYRMLAMVGLLCLVMVAIKLAARPQSWYWILPPTAEEAQQPIPLEALDFRVKQDTDTPLPLNVFRAVADADADEPEQSDSQKAIAAADSPGEQRPPESVEIDPDTLSAIEDNTLGVRLAEMDAYHEMLKRIRRLPDDVIANHTRDDVAFTVIMLQSEDYRGQLVGITGQLRRLTEFPVIENDFGIDRLYEGWVFTNDSGTNPWRFLSTELPANAELGKNIDPVKVQLEGYFFKRAGYLSAGGQHVAPTLLAKSFRILPVPANVTPGMSSGLRNGILIGVGLLVAAVLLVIILWNRSDRDFEGSQLGKLATGRLDANPDDLEALKQFDTVDPATLFEQEQSSDGNTPASPSA